VALGKDGTDERALADRLYDDLREAGIDVLYDDRDLRPGEKFVEAELLGCPLRVVAGKRSLEAGELEVQVRRGTEQRAVPIEGAAESIGELLDGLP
jgi:prolyl-tRNA synthetase